MIAETLTGDFDGDLEVDGDDLIQWGCDFVTNGDNDGDSDGADILARQRQMGMTTLNAAATPVPEPTAAAMLIG